MLSLIKYSRRLSENIVVLAGAAKVLQLSGSALILILSTVLIEKSEQGLLMTLNSIAAIQIFFELGFSSIILQYTGHERQETDYSKLDGFSGSASSLIRLKNIRRAAKSWFSYGGIACAFVIIVVGFVFFKSDSEKIWLMPLVAIGVSVAANLYAQQFWSMYEGYGYLRFVYLTRTICSIVTIALICFLFSVDLGIYTPAVSAAINALGGGFLRWRSYYFWNALDAKVNSESKVGSGNLISELMKLQLRTCVSFICGYFMFQAITPVVYRFNGPSSAAIVGIGVALILVINGFVSSIVQTQIPKLIKLISKGDFREYARVGSIIIRYSVIATLGIAILGGVVLLGAKKFGGYQALDRLPSIAVYSCFMAVCVVNQIIAVQALLSRLFKQELYVLHSVVLAALTMASTSIAAHAGNEFYVSTALLMVTILYALPSSSLIYRKVISLRTSTC